ncbi:helix-turn-helix transcriptional regulator [Flexivirga sp. ID2601S]|uniref:Helix-turn-helix transcriptional regulator n=1 Tax=Flexivirga aerilata TaxID=1656889 RepID=A0A849AGK5_9MICO|nr:helix-turn-helix transcriptional regulator [Flexivirga aerilata]NNG39974.1 helix-turn-helix transcriptional regulator [Flexivirga aerilata]
MGDVRQLRQIRPVEPLWREVLGTRLRQLRRHRRMTLADTAAIAGISPQYLSEIERGRKDPSSEIVAAVAGALGCTLTEVTDLTVRDLRRETFAAMPRGPVALAA